MKIGIEIYVSIVLITIMAILCTSFMMADVKVADARDAYYSYYTVARKSLRACTKASASIPCTRQASPRDSI